MIAPSQYFFAPDALSIRLNANTGFKTSESVAVSSAAGAAVRMANRLVSARGRVMNLGYAPDLGYRKFFFSGVNTLLGYSLADGKVNYLYADADIYVYLCLDAAELGSTGRVVFLPYELDYDGAIIEHVSSDEDGKEVSDFVEYDSIKVVTLHDDKGDYKSLDNVNVNNASGLSFFYVHIATIANPKGASARSWKDPLDCGCLDTAKGKDELVETGIGKMFKLVNNVINVLLPFDGISFAVSGASNRIKEFITLVSDKLEDFNAWKTNVAAVPSVASVFAFVSAFVADYTKRFFRRDIPDTNPNKVTFGEVSVEKGLENVDGSSSGNLSVQGSASVGSDLSVKGNAEFASDASVKGTLSAGSAAFAPAIVDGAVVPTTTVDADGIKTRKEAKMRTVVFGDYLPGLITGAEQGAKITESGDASFRSVSISGYLEVPEIRFNRATVQLGIGIRSVGGGIIEEVIPDTDADGNPLMSGRAALKLEDGEIGAIEVGDKCLGFWHNLTGNSTADRDDRNGDYELRGFSSVYFRIDAIFATEQAYRDYDTAATDNGCISKYFHYVLRGSDGTDGWNQRHHPSPNMHFGMIANNIYPDRQALKIETTQYDLSLTRMTEWNYTHSNIMEVGGLLDGFSMQAERYNEVTGEYETYTKEFQGHGRVLGQCYIFGQIDKFERQGYYCTVFQSKNGFIMPNETEMETVKVYTGYGEEVTEKFPYIKVTRDSGDSASDAVWNAEHTSVDNPFPITFADLRIDAIERISTEFHVYASDGVNQTRTSTIIFE